MNFIYKVIIYSFNLFLINKMDSGYLENKGEIKINQIKSFYKMKILKVNTFYKKYFDIYTRKKLLI